MGKLDMKEMNKTTDNSVEIDKSTDVKQTETPIESAELTDNAVEKHEDTKETDQTEQSDEAKEAEVTIVRYVGGGVWIDEMGKMWANEDKSKNILSERQYSKDEYESRNDLKFMVVYGAMKATTV